MGGWRHTRTGLSWEFEDFEKTSVEVRPLKVAIEFFRADEIGSVWVSTGKNKILDTTRCAVHGGYKFCMVSIGFYDLRLSPRVAKDWMQKKNNPFVSETTESTV